MKRFILLVIGVGSALASTQAISISNGDSLMNNQVHGSCEKGDFIHAPTWKREL